MSPHTRDIAAPEGVTLRPMRWWDLPAVLRLENRLFPEDAWSAGMFWAELADTRHPGAGRYYLVAERRSGRRLLGYAGLRTVQGEAEVQTLATEREQWGGGLGRTLLGALLREAARRECGRVLLEVRSDNSRARRMYERFGFAAIGLRPNYYVEAGKDAVVMELVDPPGPHVEEAGEERG